MSAVRASRSVVAMLVTALALGACGRAVQHAGRTRAEVPKVREAIGVLAAVPPVSLASSAASSGAPAGTALHVHAAGTTLTVTVTRVLDPLAGSGAVLPPGARAVGVLATVTDDGPGVYDSAATADLSLLIAGGAAMPVLATAGPCATPRIDFEREIEPGETRTGCVVFTVPRKQVPEAVRFAPAGVRSGGAVWALSR